MSQVILEAENVVKRFGGLTALYDVRLSCAPGEVVGLIGPNGSGKSTLINVIGGRYRADRGRISLDGTEITRLSADRRARLGLRRTFQQPMVFRGMTVERSLGLAASSGSQVNGRGDGAWDLSIDRLLRLCGLESWAGERAELLPQGKERLLSVALALSCPCRLLLLDEPAAGTTGGEGQTIARAVEAVRARGAGVIIVDHHMDFLMRIADRIVVVNDGTMLAEGTPAEVRRNPRVIEVYLGGGPHAGD